MCVIYVCCVYYAYVFLQLRRTQTVRMTVLLNNKVTGLNPEQVWETEAVLI